MKRDMDLVRDILLAVEAAPTKIKGHFTMEGREQPVVDEHVRLLTEAGFLTYSHAAYIAGKRMTLGVTLTWQGHEFLETIRDPQIWQKTKSGASKVGSWSLGLIGELAKEAVRQKAIALGLFTGI